MATFLASILVLLALYVILKSHGLGMEISGNVWSTKPAGKLAADD